MKKIYVVIFFLVFFNIFTFLFAIGGPLGIFPYAYGTGNPSYNLTSDENASSPDVFENMTGVSFDNIFSIFFADVTNLASTGLSLGIFFVATVFAFKTNSPTPLVVAFVGNIMKNTYVNNMSIFNELPINNYLMVVVGIGMILLFVVTCAEYLASGHGEV